MKKLFRVLKFDFLPYDKDLALLVLRLWIGATMLLNHGWGKLLTYSDKAGAFADPFGLGSHASLALVISSEVLGSLFLIFGLFTRLSALGGIITMTVAFFMMHHHKLSGAGNGELAFVYLAGYVTLLIAGAGRYSVDGK
jgi:putative oxidoreductase